MGKYGLTIENQELIYQRAATKVNGIYSFRGVFYAVKDKKVLYLASNGEIIQPYGNFNVLLGTYGDKHEALQHLKSLLKVNQ